MALTINASLKALVTMTELLRNLGITEALSDEKTDAYQQAINTVGEDFEALCHVPLIKKSDTEYYTGGSKTIILDRAPVDRNETFTVVEDGTTLYPPVRGTTYTSTGDTPDYYLYAEQGKIVRNGQDWDDEFEVVAVTYTAGRGWQYKAEGVKRTLTSETLHSTDVPDHLKTLCYIAVKSVLQAGPLGQSAQAIAEGISPRAIASYPYIVIDGLKHYAMPRW